MPTREQAKKAWEHGRKSIDHYNAMTDEQKTAMWAFGRDNGYISPDTLNGKAKEEFNKYVKTPWVRYAPTVSKDNMPEALKIDKYAAYDGPKVPLKDINKGKFPWENTAPDEKKYPWDNQSQKPNTDPLARFKPANKPALDPLSKFKPVETVVRKKPEEKIVPNLLPKALQPLSSKSQNQVLKAPVPNTLKPPALPTKAEPKVDKKKAKELYDLIDSGKADFNSLTEEGKKVYIQYRYDQGLLPLERATEEGKEFFSKYLDTSKLYYAPEAAGLKTVTENKLDKANGEIVGVHTESKTVKTGGEYDRHAFGSNYISTPLESPLKKTQEAKNIEPLLPPALKPKKQQEVTVINGRGKKITLNPQGKILSSDTKVPMNPAAPVMVSALNTATLGSLERNSDGMDKLREEYPIQTTAGSMLGYLAPFGAAKGIGNVATKGLTNPLLKRALSDAVTGMAVDGATEVIKGKNDIETATLNTLKGAGAGLLADGALTGLGKLSKALINKADALKLPKIEPKTIGGNLVPKGLEKPAIKPPTVQPKEIRNLPKSILNSDLANPTLKAELKNKDFAYTPITNKETLEKARQIIDTDYDKAVKIVKEGPATAESNAVGMELVNRLQKANRYTEAIDIIETISKKATESGQAIQALSMWGRLTPEGMLKYTQSMIDKANNELAEQGYKDIKKLKLTEDFAKDIVERMKTIGSMADGRNKTVEIAKVLRDIDEQLPKSVWRKISTVQTIAQLLNPKSMIRNFAGNAIFGGLENTSNIIGTPIDKLVSRLTGQRTTIMPSLKTQFEAGKVDLVEAVEDALMGIDTKGIGQKFDIGRGATFKGNTLLGKLERGMSVGLKATDAGFSGAARAESLRQQMKIAGVTEPTPGMLEIADKVAKYRTFQDKNRLSKGFNDIKTGLNRLSGFFTGTEEWGLGDLVIKYATTPANILARGIEYSPLGAVKSLNEVLKPLQGKVFDQKAFVDSLARGITGTGLIALGYQLNKMGLITGAPDKDRDVAALQRDMGKGEYRLNTSALGRYMNSFDEAVLKPQAGDTYASWDWMAPTSIMLGIGANIAQNKGDSADLLTTLVNSTASGMNTLFEQPLLTGVKKLTGGYDTSQNLINTLQGVPSSFTPSLLNQMKQLTDNTTRSTYDPSLAKETLNTVKARIPGLSTTLEPRITTLGKEKQTFGGGSNNILNVLLNPANISKYEPTPGGEMVLDIYEKSGEKIQFPRIAMTYVMHKGEKINLMPAEVTKLQTIMGEKTAKAFDQVAQNKGFRSQKPEVQAKRLQDMLTEISQEAKQQILRDILQRRNKQ